MQTGNHVRYGSFSNAQSCVEGESDESGQDREAREIVPEEGESESEETISEIGTHEAKEAALMTPALAAANAGFFSTRKVLYHLARVSSLLWRLANPLMCLIDIMQFDAPVSQDDSRNTFPDRSVFYLQGTYA